jgi:phosphatidylserine/phosphatidylglycerophosphate/cardiolipin synthase-like enzyme
MRRSPLYILFLVLIALGAWYAQRASRPAAVLQRASAGQAIEEDHFSPSENLEQIDLAQIGQAQRSLDIAMYAFTDRYLAEAIERVAERGVQVRIYRDHDQFEQEQRRSNEHSDDSTTAILSGKPNVHIRVKHSHELMHIKAYLVDGALLRDGSANWSPSGLKRQDNNAHLTTDPAQVRGFQQTFEDMWARDDNERVQ